jgi:hypothetical protein
MPKTRPKEVLLAVQFGGERSVHRAAHPILRRHLQQAVGGMTVIVSTPMAHH